MKKGLDKALFPCYNVYRKKRKGNTKMKLWYMNETTGELIDNHNHAMMWFNQGENIILLQERGGEWVKRGSWEH